MTHSVGRGFWMRLALAAGSGALFVITLVWHDWIEIVFQVDPDHGSGWLEWLIVVAAFGLALTFSISARQEWRRSTSATAVGDSAS
jgi:hypothetical protein